jgi:hypothetical protein
MNDCKETKEPGKISGSVSLVFGAEILGRKYKLKDLAFIIYSRFYDPTSPDAAKPASATPWSVHSVAEPDANGYMLTNEQGSMYIAYTGKKGKVKKNVAIFDSCINEDLKQSKDYVAMLVKKDILDKAPEGMLGAAGKLGEEESNILAIGSISIGDELPADPDPKPTTKPTSKPKECPPGSIKDSKGNCYQTNTGGPGAGPSNPPNPGGGGDGGSGGGDDGGSGGGGDLGGGGSSSDTCNGKSLDVGMKCCADTEIYDANTQKCCPEDALKVISKNQECKVVEACCLCQWEDCGLTGGNELGWEERCNRWLKEPTDLDGASSGNVTKYSCKQSKSEAVQNQIQF